MHSSRQDRQILRALAEQAGELALRPEMAQKRRLWEKHNTLLPCRALLLFYPEGAWRELIPPKTLTCSTSETRRMEFLLRARLMHWATLRDDLILPNEWAVSQQYRTTGWGLGEQNKPARFEIDPVVGYVPTIWKDNYTFFEGAEAFHPTLLDASDIKKIGCPHWDYNEAGTLEEYETAQDLIGDILPVRLRGIRHLSFHVTNQYSALRGLEQMYYDIYDEPELMHEALEVLTQRNIDLALEAERLSLLDRNNDETYHSSGGLGQSIELAPQEGRVLLRDMWGSAESQEMAPVSPEAHAEFAMRYEARYLELFGLNGYGCCDDLTRKMDLVLRLPRIRRVSISPWADIEKCADLVGNRAILSVKPNPALFAARFDLDAARNVLKKARHAAAERSVEVIVKDNHTCAGDPSRFKQFSDDFYYLMDGGT